MRFENTFDVDAPVEQVWNTLLDVERVAPTVPGAQVLERTGEESYNVAIKVKVGPMTVTYRGEVEITERDEATRRAVMKARAKESRGQGTADADVTMHLSGSNGHTSATITTDVKLTGKVATMGRGVLQDVSGRIVDTFAQNLQAMLAGGEPSPAAEAPVTGSAEAAEPSEALGAEPQPQPRPAPEPAQALDLGELGGAAVKERLRDPRALGGVVAAVALISFWLGRRSAR